MFIGKKLNNYINYLLFKILKKLCFYFSLSLFLLFILNALGTWNILFIFCVISSYFSLLHKLEFCSMKFCFQNFVQLLPFELSKKTFKCSKRFVKSLNAYIIIFRYRFVIYCIFSVKRYSILSLYELEYLIFSL